MKLTFRQFRFSGNNQSDSYVKAYYGLSPKSMFSKGETIWVDFDNLNLYNLVTEGNLPGKVFKKKEKTISANLSFSEDNLWNKDHVFSLMFRFSNQEYNEGLGISYLEITAVKSSTKPPIFFIPFLITCTLSVQEGFEYLYCVSMDDQCT